MRRKLKSMDEDSKKIIRGTSARAHRSYESTDGLLDDK